MGDIRVLLVDDDAAMVRVLSLGLRTKGYDVDAANDGAEAIERASACHHDIAVVDLGLPGVGGLEVIRVLTARDRTPVIAITGRESRSARDSAIGAGAQDLLGKPFSLQALADRMQTALGSTRCQVPMGLGVP